MSTSLTILDKKVTFNDYKLRNFLFN